MCASKGLEALSSPVTLPPLMRQTWRNLLFAHWPVPAALLRPYLPARLEVDTFEGQAWVGVVPFTMSGIRPLGLPAVPGLSRLHELNVRTYATLDGAPGVWFLSLDATNALGVWAARTFFHLPYLYANISFGNTETGRRMEARRTHQGAAPATFRAEWTPGTFLPPSRPGTLAYFLTERYRLFTAGPDLAQGLRGHDLWQGRLWHAPWRLRAAELHTWESTLLESHGLPTPAGPPLLYAADAVDVWVRGFGRVGGGRKS
ncbi:YqjF family protein [uncultured Hymenobacter sp.]|uniref:YqjF family protein n=1 Tax=uncultured Hymenobacter sp. TaxID=170016 RepID=UPI0035CA3397